MMPLVAAIWEAAARGSQVQSLPKLHSEFKANLGNLGRLSQGKIKKSWSYNSMAEFIPVEYVQGPRLNPTPPAKQPKIYVDLWSQSK